MESSTVWKLDKAIDTEPGVGPVLLVGEGLIWDNGRQQVDVHHVIRYFVDEYIYTWLHTQTE